MQDKHGCAHEVHFQDRHGCAGVGSVLRRLMQLLLGETFHAALSVSAEQNADVKPRDLQAALPGLQVSLVQHSAAQRMSLHMPHGMSIVQDGCYCCRLAPSQDHASTAMPVRIQNPPVCCGASNPSLMAFVGAQDEVWAEVVRRYAAACSSGRMVQRSGTCLPLTPACGGLSV